MLLTLTAAAVLLLPGGARAGITDPVLAVSAVDAAKVDGARTLLVQGTFEFGTVLQLGYPFFVVVFQGPTFARYPLAGAPASGTSSLLADGVLADTEVPTFLGQGSAPPAGVRVVSVLRDAVRVTLPVTFTAGAATVVLVAYLPATDGVVMSNSVSVTLP
ncbi:hypothetical protein K2Z84_11050 [Candidatus Binatia bacterium]|jgi:hypothetical protein|nr:hypothetical protein [Candidatus Binatia bacterium]